MNEHTFDLLHNYQKLISVIDDGKKNDRVELSMKLVRKRLCKMKMQYLFCVMERLTDEQRIAMLELYKDDEDVVGVLGDDVKNRIKYYSRLLDEI
jgi:hypothetical protein